MNIIEKYKVHLDEKDQRFEIKLEDEVAYLDYRWSQDRLMLLYIFVPVPFRGKGVSNVLIEYALNFAREKGTKIQIYCPYIVRYVRNHPQHHDLLEQPS